MPNLTKVESMEGPADLRNVREADGLFAVVNGCPPDEGVMVALGLAIAWEKPIFLFRDDFRQCTDSEDYPLNLMLFAGLPATGWEAAWYSSIKEIADPDKALARWLRHDLLARRRSKRLRAHKGELCPLDRYMFIDKGGIEANPGSRSHLTPDSRTLSADAKRSESRRWR